MARGEAPPARLRARGRGLAPGRHRDRRVAARRALPPAGRADRRRRGRGVDRAPAARFPRSTCTARSPPARSTWGGGADTAPPPGSPSGRRTSTRSRRRSPRTRPRRSPRPICEPVLRVDAVVRRAGADARPLRGARAPRAVRARQPGRDAARRRLRALRARRRGGGQAPQARGDGERRPLGRDRVRPGRHASTASAASGAYDVAFKLAANHWNGTVSPQLVVKQDLRDAGGLRGAPPAARGRVEGGPGALEPAGARDLRGARAGRARRAAGGRSSSRRPSSPRCASRVPLAA